MTAVQAARAADTLDTSHVRARQPPLVLEAAGVSKRFGALAALDSVDFRLTPGSFHALLGENGAGKSTLVKCIMGFYQADEGRISVGGQPITVKSPKEAQRHGIGMVYQHFTLVENMTVAENLVLSRADVPRVIDWKKEKQEIESFMDEMPFRISPERLVRKLAAGEKQKLEILKQLYVGSRIVILDEPTSVLTPQEADEVLGMLREMAYQGRVSVAMITHKFREVVAYSDEVTVLRRGKLAGTGKTKDLTPEAMAEMMVGAEVPRAQLDRRDTEVRSNFFVLDKLCANDDLGLKVLEEVSLSVAAGEIVGIAGVSGNGQDELVEVLAGQRPTSSGAVRVEGKDYKPTRAQMRERRVRLLPEAPLKNACVGNMSVAENIGFRSYDVPPNTSFGWLVRGSSLRSRARAAIKEYGIKAPGPDAPISGLSGGNVQRAVLARELTGEVNVLVAANPCFGLDFAAVSEIRTRIMAARNSGSAVLLVSSDLEEIFALSDRILVMSEGRIVYESKASEANMADIGRHMGGAHH